MLHICVGMLAATATSALSLWVTDPSLAPSIGRIDHALEAAQQAPTWTPSVVVGVAGAIIAFLTAAVAFYNSGFSPARLKRHEIRLQYVEEQLSKLYGPLFAECIKADSIFRRVELMFNNQAHHHNKDFVDLDLMEAATAARTPFRLASRRSRASLLAWAVREIYLPSNERKMALLSNNLHLFGPYPPLSFYLFMTHSAQMQALMQLKKAFLVPKPRLSAASVGSGPAQAGNNPADNDPYMMVPFPFIFTAEVAAKVALLKALQREYRHRIGKHFDPGEVFSRKTYYLLLHDPQDRSCLAWLSSYGFTYGANDTIRDVMNNINDQKNYFIASCPLLCGPYTGLEMLELRAWLINKEIPARAMNNLRDQRIFYAAMLHAAVVEPVDRDEFFEFGTFSVPLHYRVTQGFDEIDQSGSKSGFAWKREFRWSDLTNGSAPQLATRFKWYRPTKSKAQKTFLKDLQNPDGFAYNRGRFERMTDESGSKNFGWGFDCGDDY